MLVSCLVYSLTMKMEAIYSSETSVDFQSTIWRYVPEDITLQNHCCENLTSYNPFTCHSLSTSLKIIRHLYFCKYHRLNEIKRNSQKWQVSNKLRKIEHAYDTDDHNIISWYNHVVSCSNFSTLVFLKFSFSFTQRDSSLCTLWMSPGLNPL
jgi:hypothetical protein